MDGDFVLALKREYAGVLTSGAQLALVWIGGEIGEPGAWVVCAGLIAAISLFAWMSTYRRTCAIRDTPTSKIASAAQGYAEIIGRGRPLGGEPLLSKLRRVPCLWYRYRVTRKKDKDNWEVVASGESRDSFIIDDGTGECLVDPTGAEILGVEKESWTELDYRYTEARLMCDKTIYALGQFETKSGTDLSLDRDEAIKAILAEWKQNPPELLRRFDLDNNGELDVREWELARAEARREATRMANEAAASPGVHTLRRPEDGRLYLLSGKPQEELANEYRWWSMAHLTMFFGGLAGAVIAFRMTV